MSQVVTKFPTTTTTIVAGWTNPTNAYAEDGNCASSSTNGAEQKYGGWNFTTSDIPPGSTITKVEMGAKHYEVNPSGYIHITQLKHVNTAGAGIVYTLTRRSTLTWDWCNITSRESSWDLTKLNNADVRIIMYESAAEGGCLFEKGDVKTYVLGEDETGFWLKPASEVKLGDTVIVWIGAGRRLERAKVVETHKMEGVLRFVNIVFRKMRAPSLVKTGEYVEFQPYTIVTADQPIIVCKRVDEKGEKFTAPEKITAEELYNRVLAGEEFWIGGFRNWKIQDNYPLMGTFYDFEVVGFYNETYHVQVISNSTVSELNLVVWLSSPNEYLQPGQEFLLFYVEGEADTSGFCRVTIPRALLNDSYIVLVDWTEVPTRQLDASNSTNAYLYFTYNHTKHEVIIIPEFPSTITLPCLMLTNLIATLLLKKRPKNKTQTF